MHLEVSQCLSQTAFHLPRHAAVVIGFGIFRIELDRLIVVRDGPIEVTPAPPGAAAVVVGVSIFRIELDRPVEVLDGPVEVALGAPGAATVGVGEP